MVARGLGLDTTIGVNVFFQHSFPTLERPRPKYYINKLPFLFRNYFLSHPRLMDTNTCSFKINADVSYIHNVGKTSSRLANRPRLYLQRCLPFLITSYLMYEINIARLMTTLSSQGSTQFVLSFSTQHFCFVSQLLVKTDTV